MRRVFLALGFSLIYGNIIVWSIVSNTFHIGIEENFWSFLQFMVTSLVGFTLVAAYAYASAVNRRTKILIGGMGIAFLLSTISIGVRPYLSFERLDLIVFNSLIFVSFIVAGVIPVKRENWKSSGMYSAFIVSFFGEMYGFPLTLYVVSSLSSSREPLTLTDAHLLARILGLERVHIMSVLVIAVGLFLLIGGWRQIYSSKGRVVTNGIYRYLAHPQYVGILLITAGLLIEFPTFPTLGMWIIILILYYRTAKKETRRLHLPQDP